MKFKLKKVYLWGYYGSNYGDNIMLHLITNHLKKYKGIAICVVSAFYKLGCVFDDLDIQVININIGTMKSISSLLEMKRIAKNSLNIWGGGTIFTDEEGDGAFKYFFPIKLFGGKYAYISIGIGNMNNITRILKTKILLKFASLCIFREKKSYIYANKLLKSSSMKLTVAEDIVYLYVKEYIEINSSNVDSINEKYILISWRNLNSYIDNIKETSIMDEIIINVSKLSQEFNIFNIKLLALDTNYDYESCLVLNEKLSQYNMQVRVEVIKNPDINYVTAVIQNAFFHFSGRLHGSMISEMLGVPTLTINYSNKIQYFYNELNSDNYITLEKYNVNYERIKKIFYDRHNYTEFLNTKVKEANKTFDMLDEYIMKHI